MAKEKDVYSNLQINYFVISKSWDILNNGKKDKGAKNDFYESFGLTRNSVSCLINDPANAPNLINIWNRSEKKLASLGLPKEIMLGKEVISVKGISEDEWKEYFDFISAKEATDKEATDKEATDKEATDKEATDKEATAKENKKFRAEKNDRQKELVKRLEEALKEIHPNRHSSDPLGILFYYLSTGQRIDTDQTDYQIKELQFALNNIKCDHWKDCDETLLVETIKAMTLQLKNATTVYEYKKLQ